MKLSTLLSIMCFYLISNPVCAINWDKLTGQQITLFYPGQSSWEWLLTAKDHGGAKNIRKGKTCIECHADEELEMGAKLIKVNQSQSALLSGKPGTMQAHVKMAYDSENFYVQIRWQDGATASANKMDKKFASRVTMMLDDGHVTEASRAGCWGTCHDDAIGMPSAIADNDITKYLARSRLKITRSGGGTRYKEPAALQEMQDGSVFMEYWQARLNPGQPAIAVDGYILDQRHRSETPLVVVSATSKDGHWIVEMSRKRQANLALHKNIVSGQTYTVGFAIHDDYANHRHHFVSFGRSFVLEEGEADFIVKHL